MLKRLLAVLIVSFVFSAVARPKYVFMFIGDGMSIPQRTIAEEYLRKTRGEQIIFNHFPFNAATKTSSANGFITDSAASGTALACGEKTNNGMLGVLPDGTTPLVSSAVVAKQQGMKVGIITSVTINHATPAAFYAHVKSRGMNYDIGLDLLASGFEYFAGGGCMGVNDEKHPKYRGNLYEVAATKEFGYKVGLVKTTEDMKAYRAGDSKVWIRGSEGYLNACLNDDNKSVQLCDYVAKGIELLDNPNGFFMMCEGGAIDSGGHANDAGYTLGEALALNDAVKVAYDFAQKHANETLIVVTGDHETGGLTLGFANTGIGNHVERLALQKRTGSFLNNRVFERVHGKGNVTLDVAKDLVTECFSLKFTGAADDPMVLTADEIALLETSFKAIVDKDIIYQNHKKANADEKTRKGARKAATDASGAFARKVQQLFCKRTGLMYTTGGHSSLPVITSAWGYGAEAFSGKLREATARKMDNLAQYINYKTPQAESAKIEGDYENTEVSRRIKAILLK